MVSAAVDVVAAPATASSGDVTSVGLTTETETPEDLQKIAAESLYPPTASPQNLTAEQLDAISKLAPKQNKLGMQVHPAMVPLFRSIVLNYTGGTYQNAPIRFRLHTPDAYQPGKKYPLVVWLHGSGECGSDNVNQLSHLHHIIPSLVGPKKRDFFLLVPQCPHTHWAWEAAEVCKTTILADGSVQCRMVDDPVARGDAPIAFTLAMVDAVLKEFPVDPNRVTVAGLSTGGDGTWRILERRPDLFAAAVPVVSWKALQGKSLREHPILKKIPIWAIYSSDDNGIDSARKDFERIRDSGCHVYKTEFGVCGHRAWTPAMLQGDVFGWLISRAKDGDRYYAAERSPTSPETIGVFADVTVGDLAKRTPTKAVRPGKAVVSNPQPPTAASIQKAMQEAKESLVQARENLEKIARKKMEERAVPVVPPAQTATGSGVVTLNPFGIPLPGTSYPNSTVVSEHAKLAGESVDTAIEQFRLDLIHHYIEANEIKKALAVADKVKDRKMLVYSLLQLVEMEQTNERNWQHADETPAGATPQPKRRLEEILDYVDRELDRVEQRSKMPVPSRFSYNGSRHIHSVAKGEGTVTVSSNPRPKEEPLAPIPAGKKTPKDDCGKEWAMSSTTQYGLYPNGWDQESARVPDYVLNETGRQLRDRVARAFMNNDLTAMKEFCDSFIRLDDIPLSSPWFDTSGGRLHGRIKYTLNERAKPVVELLRDIAAVKAESKRAFVELARKSLKRIDAITHPKTDE